jgi:hypothetical protein
MGIHFAGLTYIGKSKIKIVNKEAKNNGTLVP